VKDAQWSINKVTVYNDRAEIRRSLQYEAVGPGIAELKLKGLPNHLQADSVRASVSSRNAVIAEVSYDSVWEKNEDDDTEAEKRAKLEELKEAKEQIMRERSNNDLLLGLLREYENSVATEKESGSMDGVPFCVSRIENLEDMSNFMSFFSEQKLAYRLKNEELNAELNKLQQEIQELDRNTRNGSDLRQIQEVSILIEIPEETMESNPVVSLDLVYIVLNASWTASYDVHVDRENDKVVINYYGELVNNTGEDWKDVSMVFSTAKPSVGGELPVLPISNVSLVTNTNFLLQQNQNKRNVQKLRTARYNANLMSNFFIQEELNEPIQQQQQQEGFILPLDLAQNAKASSSGSSNVLFKMKRLVSIESDGLRHKQMITVVEMHSVFTHAAAPKVSDKVYLKCSSRNTSEYPILPGPTKVFINGFFLAESRTGLVQVNEEFVLFLGVDESVKVDIRPSQKKTETVSGGVIKGKPKKVRKTVHVRRIKNNSPSVVQFVLYEQIPVPRDGKIKFELIKPDVKKKTKGFFYKVNDLNQLEAKHAINPNDVWEFRMEYMLEWPAESGDVSIYTAKN